MAHPTDAQCSGLKNRNSLDDHVGDDGCDQDDKLVRNELTDTQTLDVCVSPLKQFTKHESSDISSDDSEGEGSKVAKNNTGNKRSHALQGGKRKLDAVMYPINDAPRKEKLKYIPIVFQKPVHTFKNVGGMDKTLRDLYKLLLQIRYQELYKNIGIPPPKAVLLDGPPGCGKTLLANAIAGELNVPIIKVAAPELVNGVSGESGETIHKLYETAVSSAPCVVFIKEIDGTTPYKQTELIGSVTRLLNLIDDLSNIENGGYVLVIGAMNRPDTIDPALPGRFDKKICMGIPNAQARSEILKVLTSKLKLSDNFDFGQIAKYTAGYVGADLSALTKEAVMLAVGRVFDKVKENLKLEPKIAVENEVSKDAPLPTVKELHAWLHGKYPLDNDLLKSWNVTTEDFVKAMKYVQPAAKSKLFATVPDITWDDIGSLRHVREQLQMLILAPVRHEKQFDSLGLRAHAGALLCGPPGCGKTMIAKAIANEAEINFISVKGPELLDMFAGDNEQAVRVCFERAQSSAPCVIFFEELEVLCPKRSDSRGSEGFMTVVKQMLTEVDGLETRKNVFLLAASNRPDMIDPLLLKRGRFDKILYVDLPTACDRVSILRAITKNSNQARLALDVDLKEIGLSNECSGFTGADLAALVQEAGLVAMKEFMFGYPQELLITLDHFKRAVMKIKPSIPEKDRIRYEKMREMLTVEQVTGSVFCHMKF